MAVKRALLWIAALAGALAVSGPASAALIYQNNFDAPAQLGAGISLAFSGPNAFRPTTVGTWNAAGWSGNAYVNVTTGNPATLTQFSFSGLASHTSISLGGVLGFLESWDSTNGNPAPDLLNVYIDGTLKASLTANNGSGTIEIFDGGTIVAHYQQVDNSAFFSDTLIDMATANFANFAHTGSTLTIGFQAGGGGWQGGADEAWGLDSFSVTSNADVAVVPEPASLAIWGLGALGCVVARYRRRRQAA